MNLESKVSKLERLVEELKERVIVERDKTGINRRHDIEDLGTFLSITAKDATIHQKELKRIYRMFKIGATIGFSSERDIGDIRRKYESVVSNIRGISENLNGLLQAIYESPNKFRQETYRTNMLSKYGNKVPERLLSHIDGLSKQLTEEYERNKPLVELRHRVDHGKSSSGIESTGRTFKHILPRISPKKEYIPKHFRAESEHIEINKFLDRALDEKLDFTIDTLEKILSEDITHFNPKTKKKMTIGTMIDKGLTLTAKVVRKINKYAIIGLIPFMTYQMISYQNNLIKIQRDAQIKYMDFIGDRISDREAKFYLDKDPNSWEPIEIERVIYNANEIKQKLNPYIVSIVEKDTVLAPKYKEAFRKSSKEKELVALKKFINSDIEKRLQDIESEVDKRLQLDYMLQNAAVFEKSPEENIEYFKYRYDDIDGAIHDNVAADIIRARAVTEYLKTGVKISNAQIKNWTNNLISCCEKSPLDPDAKFSGAFRKDLENIFTELGSDPESSVYILENHTYFFKHLQGYAKTESRWKEVSRRTTPQEKGTTTYYGGHPRFEFPTQYLEFPLLRIKVLPENINIAEIGK
jgi:hypothetical protein